MNAGNPRSLMGSRLWGSRWRHSSRGKLFPLLGLVAIAVIFLFAINCVDAQVQRPGGALDRAELEPFRYEEPPADLMLDEDGVRKRDALLLYYRGSCLADADIPARLKFFKRVIELDPSNIVLAMETATHCAAQGRFSDAQSILEESLSNNGGKRDAYLNLSRYCDRYHNDDDELKSQALEYAEMAVEKFPRDHVVIEHLARLLIEREEPESAEDVLEEALKREVANGDYWLAMANIARDVWPMRSKENRERVLKVYELALRADPGNLEVVETVAQFHRMIGNTERAILIYRALVQRSPDRLSARENLADLYWEAGAYREALAGLEALVQINPDASEVRRKLSDMYLAVKELAKAIGHAEVVIESGDVEIDDFVKLAELQLYVDRVAGALQTLRRGASVYPLAPQLSSSLGRVYLNLERFPEAYAAFNTAETLAETELPSYLDNGFYFTYAVSAERAGDFDRAEQLFRRAIKLVPADKEEEKARSLNYLGYMWLEREKNIDEAGEMIQRANDLKPDDGAYLDSLGWFFHLKGDYDQAIEHLLRAEGLMEEEPDSVVFEHLARSFFASGEKEKAKHYLDRALELEPGKEELKSFGKLIESGGSEADAEAEAKTDSDPSL